MSSTNSITTSHGHGGQLTQASEQYDIPVEDWMDLSTGISPFTYPLPNFPDECWQRLPESNDGLEIAATNYYGSETLLPVSGSQEAIQKLPLLFNSELFKAPLKIGFVTPAYHSHQQAWENAGHTIVLLNNDEIENALTDLDILLLVNPTNPNCYSYRHEDLLKWHQRLVKHNGFLIIDEAFIDCIPDESLIEQIPKQGLIVLRSIGKFFGLAGIRLGFVWAEAEILQKLSALQDDWAVSNPARWAGKIALGDSAWQQQQRIELARLGLRLHQLLSNFITRYVNEKQAISGGVSLPNLLNDIHDYSIKHTHLFAYFEHPDAGLIHEKLAQQGILTRLFIKSHHQQTAIRFGLPANDKQWLRLQEALSTIRYD